MPLIILQSTDLEINGENVSISSRVMKNLDFSTILLLTDNGVDKAKNTMSILGRFALKLKALNRDSVFYATDISSFPMAKTNTNTAPILLKVWAGGMIDDQPLSSGEAIQENAFLQILLHLAQHDHMLDGGLSLSQDMNQSQDGFRYGGLAGSTVVPPQKYQLDINGNDRTILAANGSARVGGDGTMESGEGNWMHRIKNDACLQRRVFISVVLLVLVLKFLQK